MKEVLAAIGLVVALPALAIMWMAGESPERAEAKEQKAFEINARVMCADSIKTSLRNPSSAEWDGRATWPIIDDGDGRYTVIAKYRAENGFGGMVKETRQCLVVRREDRAAVLAVE